MQMHTESSIKCSLIVDFVFQAHKEMAAIIFVYVSYCRLFHYFNREIVLLPNTVLTILYDKLYANCILSDIS